MNHEKHSLYQRIRNVKQSLENAEKSFLDDKGMRGELDLMLAEAELKNLRQKQTFPWNWNRNSLAFCVAVLLLVSGLGGWFFAKEDLQKAEAVQNKNAAEVQIENHPIVSVPKNNNSDVSQQNRKTISTTDNQERSRVQLSKNDMQRLVRSARKELSSGK